MARALVLSFCLLFVVCRASHVSHEGLDREERVSEEVPQLLFAPARLLSSGDSSPCVADIWRRDSHLRPCSRRWRLSCCAGDVERNPGPNYRYPCMVCYTPVTSRQRGVECTKCERWTHATCGGVSRAEYAWLSENEHETLYYLKCQLPFANASLNSSCVLDTSPVTEMEESYTESGLDSFEGCANSLVFCHLNMRSLLPKIDECRQFVQQTTQPLILGATETWLNESVCYGEVAINQHRLYRRDRRGRGGGVLLYVPVNFRSSRRADLESDGAEALWLEIRTKITPVLVGVVYRPPDAPASVLENLCDMFEAATLENKEVVIMGDFNCNTLSPDAGTQSLQRSACECNLEQLISEPTRITNHHETLIDLIFVSHPDRFVKSGCLDVIDSDHLMTYACTAKTSC